VEEKMEAAKLMKFNVKEKVVDGKRFSFIEIEDKSSYKNIIWLNSKYRDETNCNEVNGILTNACMFKTEKKNIVIRKGANNIFFIFVKCGYRGGSDIKVLSEHVNVIEYCFNHSPRGNLGMSTVAIVETPIDYVKIEWKRTGRLYGSPSKGISIVKKDGLIETIENIDLEEIKEILTE
jgi:hypothetical protein